jgi:arsenate reductase (thioredoxin)
MTINRPVIKILFLCTGNSCRSQMAEGWARHLLPTSAQVFSAGVNPGKLDPIAVQAMAEAGVDISAHRPRHIREFSETTFDYVITVCDNARESCPIFPGVTNVIHRPFDDPPHLVKLAATEEDRLAAYRRVRDEIRSMVEGLPIMFSNHVLQTSAFVAKEGSR